MRNLTALIAIPAFVFGTVSLASAADLTPPPAMPSKAPPVYYAPPPFSWTGFYLGGNLGWGWTSGNGTITIGGASGPISGSGNGFLGGVQGGYNWQASHWVFGLEGDFQGSTGSGDLNGSAGKTTITGTLKTPWFATFRGRVGYAANRWLYYVTGGGVYGHATYDGTLSTTGPFSSSTDYLTWTLGGGVEAALWGPWSAKLEYLYIGTPDKMPVPPGTTDLTGSVGTSIVRAGLNYRF